MHISIPADPHPKYTTAAVLLRNLTFWNRLSMNILFSYKFDYYNVEIVDASRQDLFLKHDPSRVFQDVP